MSCEKSFVILTKLHSIHGVVISPIFQIVLIIILELR